jgi:hypothetical protein
MSYTHNTLITPSIAKYREGEKNRNRIDYNCNTATGYFRYYLQFALKAGKDMILGIIRGKNVSQCTIKPRTVKELLLPLPLHTQQLALRVVAVSDRVNV